jgi:hydroxyacylglutathione hydrolase
LERRFTRFLSIGDENEFVRELTRNLAPQPPNFKRIVALNKGPLLTDVASLEPIAPARLQELLGKGAILLDGRATREFDAEHVPGSVNVTMDRAAVGTRAAWIADADVDVVVTAAGEGEARRFGRLLEAVGFRALRGHLAGGVSAWREAGLETGSTPVIDVPELADRLRRGGVRLLDVRDDDEWEEGHVGGSFHVPYHELRDGVPPELRNGGPPLAVACSVGNRSSIAASLLKRAGVTDVLHVVDGGVSDLAREDIDLVEGK